MMSACLYFLVLKNHNLCGTPVYFDIFVYLHALFLYTQHGEG